jgi:tetratricopeptide (TPR) repeat protein
MAALAMLLSAPAKAEYLDQFKQRLLIQVQQEIYRDDFAAADSISNLLIQTYPDDPAGPFFKGSTLLSHMFASEENFGEEEFAQLMDSAINLSAQARDTCSPATAAWMHLFSGHALSHRSLHQARFGSLVKALRTALEAKDHYEAGVEEDEQCYDLLFGLGLYHYWKSAKAGILRKIGVFSDDIDLGLRELQLAADASAISREAARNGLIWIWLDRRQYDAAIEACHEMLEKYPGGTVFLWPLAQAYFAAGQPVKAIDTYQKLRERILVDPGNYYNLIECDFNLVLAYQELESKDSAVVVARQVREYESMIPSPTAKRQRDKLAYLKRAARL